jgi:hypothetical protein
MSMTITRDEGPIRRLTISGMARRSDLDQVMHTLEGEIGDRGVVRLLVLLDGFTGWAQTDDWSGLSFYVNHGDQIERIAIVGESRWRDDAMMFALADLRRAPVEFFAPGAIPQALNWLRQV